MAVGYAAYILPLLLLGCWAEAYLDLCYCPGVDQELVEVDKPAAKSLRDKLHQLRRQYTEYWNIYSPPAMPNPGVPPTAVLQNLVPHASLRDLAQWTEVQYNRSILTYEVLG